MKEHLNNILVENSKFKDEYLNLKSNVEKEKNDLKKDI
jgi:hypothetical protein